MAKRGNDDGPMCTDDPYPRYAPGIYQVRVGSYKQYFDPRFQRWKIRFVCHFLDEEGEVSGFFNLADERVGRGSRYWQAWVEANGEQPKRRDRLSPRVFLGKIFEVRIGDVEHHYAGRQGPDQTTWKKHPEAAKYSTIQEWIKCVGP